MSKRNLLITLAGVVAVAVVAALLWPRAAVDEQPDTPDATQVEETVAPEPDETSPGGHVDTNPDTGPRPSTDAGLPTMTYEEVPFIDSSDKPEPPEKPKYPIMGVGSPKTAGPVVIEGGWKVASTPKGKFTLKNVRYRDYREEEADEVVAFFIYKNGQQVGEGVCEIKFGAGTGKKPAKAKRCVSDSKFKSGADDASFLLVDVQQQNS